MAVSAFRSTSKRNLVPSSNTSSPSKENNTEDLGKKIPSRRSRSVSAVSRVYSEVSPPITNICDFSNKRDNPLFCSSNPSSPDELESEKSINITRLAENSSKYSETVSKSASSGVSDRGRGRSVSRNSNSKNQSSGPRKEYGRSLSRVDTGRRRRSVSRGHCGNSESEIDNDYNLASSLMDKNAGNFTEIGRKNANSVTKASDLSKKTRSLQTWSSRHPLSEPLDSVSSALSWEDGISTSSFSEAEEKTIKAVCEQMKSDRLAGDAANDGIYETVRSEVMRAVSEIRNDLESAICGKNPAIIMTANVADIPPELVNPDAVELVSDIRREYAMKLEQSQERARKLRADLAIEEQRGQELSRILEEILPDPKMSETQKSRARRKQSSIERKKMSKRLAEEAMSYFDECVSISTFDSSDFSATEDPAVGSVATALQCGSSGASTTQGCIGHLSHDKESDTRAQCYLSRESFDLTASSGSRDAAKEIHAVHNQPNPAPSDMGHDGNLRFSFSSVDTEGIHDIKNYIKEFEKEFQKDVVEHWNAASSYDADGYSLNLAAEKVLFDRVIFKNRIMSGGLLLCDVRFS